MSYQLSQKLDLILWLAFYFILLRVILQLIYVHIRITVCYPWYKRKNLLNCLVFLANFKNCLYIKLQIQFPVQ